jgi:hypothetical protein
MICISEKYNVEARIIGFVEKGKEENTLIIKKNNEQYLYSLE